MMTSFSAPKNKYEHVEKLARDTTPDLVNYFERRVILRHEAQDLCRPDVARTLRESGTSPRPPHASPYVVLRHRTKRAADLLRAFRSRQIESAESIVLARRLSAAMASALERLSPDVRELTLLVEVDGLSNREAARRLDLNEDTARAMRMSGLEQLRRQLAKRGDHDAPPSCDP